ncbi:MAG: AMP-binding protein [Butyribacter sp.]|nr:AMP-binding protein [bacterium]MDY3853531.1 AMP-binding protein [Butyribacter sp.]
MLIRDILEESEKKYADIPAVKWLKKKEMQQRTYGELMQNVAAVRKGLLANGFQKKHVALLGNSSAEWMESYLGVITGSTVAVPLDAGLPAEDLTDLINRSDAEALFLSPKKKSLLDTILAECPKLQKVWLLQEEPVEEEDEKVSSYAELKTIGSNNENDEKSPEEEDIATIIFTSGTTGKSKGVMLTQKNLAENVLSVDFVTNPGSIVLSVLPIHHAYCLVMDWLKGFSLGVTVCINDSLLHMVRNMGIFKPDIMLMVPMMIETIYKRLSAADPAIPKQILAEKVFGGNLKIIFTGGAHLDSFYIDEFAQYGIDVLEGYGMSECSPVISSNTQANHKTGSIGRPLSNVEISFEDGEILVRGSSVMKGYYKMPEETKETLKDGWLHTGDKGYQDEDGYLFINGRVKNLIILSNGENISPEEIENKLALGELVGEVIVTGENNGLTARIYPDQEIVQAKGMEPEMVQEKLQEFLDAYNKTQPTYRQITGLVVRKNPFIRSSTKKIKRQEALIDEPYDI